MDSLSVGIQPLHRSRWRDWTQGNTDLRDHPAPFKVAGIKLEWWPRCVGIRTDASVQRLKGPARPVQSEVARATVIASIGAVDLVVLFDEDTPLELIAAFRPDLLFKGADYREDQVVGRRVGEGIWRIRVVDRSEGRAQYDEHHQSNDGARLKEGGAGSEIGESLDGRLAGMPAISFRPN